MKKLLTGFCLFLLASVAHSQNGLESVIVEKYYVSNAADSAGSVGLLPVGSVTYRIYADMLPGYKFQALYGVTGHELRLSSTTPFFNNEDRGDVTPNGISVTNTTHNTVMIDSWFSVGATAAGKMGVLKTEDSDGSIGNANSILQNNDASAGIAIHIEDGMVAGSPESVTFVGLDNGTGNHALDLFNATSQLGSVFSTFNGSVASLNGSTGPTATNRVLIGQFTTKGIFHYELNIQIGTPQGGTQNYVAQNPVGTEISIPSLMGTLGAPNVLPTVNITSPANGGNFKTTDVVPINATAADADGTVDSVTFFANGVRIGVDVSAPYSINWTPGSAGSKTLTAMATDNSLGQTTSAGVTVNVTVNVPSTVNITSPTGGSLFTFPATVTINANAADADGTVDSVAFFINNVRVGVDVSSPYSFNWTSVIGSASLTAKAYDNNNAVTTSAPVSITIVDPNALPYSIVTTSASCQNSLFCLNFAAVDTVHNVIGYDLVLHYNVVKVEPTGVINVSNALINPNWVDVGSYNDPVHGTLNISLYFNSSAPANARFTGVGNVFCAEFSKTTNFGANDTAAFTVSGLQESYFTGITPKLADAGKYISFPDTAFVGSLKFWANNGAIKYDIQHPTQNLITNIYGNNSNCTAQSASAVQPDTSGNFSYSVSNGSTITITKDIASATSVQPVINGFDAFLTRKVLLSDLSLTPSIFQIISMDVNMDGVISAGDLSQINQRAVLLIPEFKQAWNYDTNGVSNGQASKDWLFIDGTTLNSNLAYRISNTYPANDGVGYSKARVPVVPFCLPVPITTSAGCNTISTETYKGVLLGDVNGNYATVGSGGVFRNEAGEKIIIDLSKAVNTGGYFDIPVSVSSPQAVNALDLSINFNESVLSYQSVINQANYLQALSNYNGDDHTLRVTSNSMQNYEQGKSLMSLHFSSNADKISETDLQSVESYLNGEKVNVEIRSSNSSLSTANMVSVYPNPATNVLNVTTSQDATLQLFDVEGRVVIMQTNATANQTQQLNTQGIAAGVYMLKVYNDSFVAIQKVVINK